MRPRTRLAGFALLLVIVFGGAVAVGRAAPQVHDDGEVGRTHPATGHEGAE